MTGAVQQYRWTVRQSLREPHTNSFNLAVFFNEYYRKVLVRYWHPSAAWCCFAKQGEASPQAVTTSLITVLVTAVRTSAEWGVRKSVYCGFDRFLNIRDWKICQHKKSARTTVTGTVLPVSKPANSADACQLQVDNRLNLRAGKDGGLHMSLL